MESAEGETEASKGMGTVVWDYLSESAWRSNLGPYGGLELGQGEVVCKIYEIGQVILHRNWIGLFQAFAPFNDFPTGACRSLVPNTL